MYSEEEYRKAPEGYEETKSVTKTITILEYLACRQTDSVKGSSRFRDSGK
jgi:hypothetical protein